MEKIMVPSAILFLMMMLVSCLPYILCKNYAGYEYWGEEGNNEDGNNGGGNNGYNMPSIHSSSNDISVTDYGAKGDGKSDDTMAFTKAWKKACSTKNGVLVVPSNKDFLVGPISFSGPCKDSLTMKVYGTILASADRSDYKKNLRYWIRFDNIDNFLVVGGGTFNGNGKVWWQNSCKINKSKPCKRAPTAVTFIKCRNLRLETLIFKNAQQMTVNINKCIDVTCSSLKINSPEWSPNTDGIHITNSRNVLISNCSIKTGDDCISIETGTRNIDVTDIACGPGHGISIGSLGDANTHATVSNVTVTRANITGTANGVRIKTWQGGSGYARYIKFEDITMHNVTNPIIIDQYYCDQKNPCKEKNAAVQLEKVIFSNIKGTSASNKAISIECSKTHTCKGIVLQNVNLRTLGDDDEVVGECKNAELYGKGDVYPRPMC